MTKVAAAPPPPTPPATCHLFRTEMKCRLRCGSPGSEGVVEDVVLLGAPVDGSEKAWEKMARVVAGKIVNGYCR